MPTKPKNPQSAIDSTASRQGRPSELTPRRLAAIISAARSGLKDTQIYAAQEIPKQTWHEWLKRAEFSDAIARARAELAQELLIKLQSGPSGWQALVWMLNLHFPNDYPRPGTDGKVQHSGSIDSTQKLIVSEEELNQTRAARRRYQEQLRDALYPNEADRLNEMGGGNGRAN